MTGRQWQPGDVAMVDGHVAVVCKEGVADDRPTFFFADEDGDACSVWADPDKGRPLLVIDPDDRDQLARFRQEYVARGNPKGFDGEAQIDNMQAALRAMLEPPAPPKPDEPGAWGVVEALTDHGKRTGQDRRVYVHLGNDSPLWFSTAGELASWDDLTAPVVIRPGITPDEPEAESDLPPDLIDRDGRCWVTGATGLYAFSEGREAWWGFRRQDVEEQFGPVREVPHGSAVTQ